MSVVLITGASRGIGLALVREYAARGDHVIATCRRPADAGDLQALADAGADIRIEALDVADFQAVDALAARLDGQPIDVLINNAGIHGPRDSQSLGRIDFAEFDPVIRVNTLAPLKMAEAFLSQVAASDEKKIVTVTSALGSISRTHGGQYIYRASKAAVNMCMATFARDTADRGLIVSVLSPGYVDTDFTRGTSDMPKISVDVSAAGLANMIAGLTADDSGALLRYNGERLSW
jgi:NAD(P)-dependent dehydrogenase (short-subunit alcohol dehydrogenase family)